MIENLESNFNKGMTELKEEHLKPIREQVMKTNGRVSKLELWRSLIAGAVGVFMALPAISSILKILNK